MITRWGAVAMRYEVKRWLQLLNVFAMASTRTVLVLRMSAHLSLVLFVLAVSCTQAHKPTHHPNTHCGIALLTDGPRGGGYTDPSGRNVGYRIFRVHVVNDSTIPAELEMDFPGGPITMLPDTDYSRNVFMLPDEICPGTARDTFNFGIAGVEAFLSTWTITRTSLRASIPAGEEHILYIGTVRSLNGPHHERGGVLRAELFIEGQRPQGPYFPEGSIPAGTRNESEPGLLFGLGMDPPKDYALIPCGRIVFTK